MKDYYSPLKIFHHRDKLNCLQLQEHTSPVHVQVVPTNRCNMNCDFCAYRTQGYSSNREFDIRDEIPNERFLDLATELFRARIKAVEITGGGEPTLHPMFAQFCKRLQEYQIDYGVVTNGSVQTEEVATALKEASWVRFSIDAGTEETYQKTRKTTKSLYEEIYPFIESIATDSKTIVGIGFVVTRNNWLEIEHAVVSAKSYGANNIRISAVFQNEGSNYFQSIYSEIKKSCHRAKMCQDKNFTVFDLFGERLNDLEQKSPTNPTCHVQRLVTYIGADQNVYRCCIVSYNPLGLLGSIKDQPFDTMWVSLRTEEKLSNFDARQCPRCMFNRKNEVIRYALLENPPHVNFL